MRMASELSHSYDIGEGPQVYKVAELTREIKGLLENSFSEVMVEGEISNYLRGEKSNISSLGG